MSALRPGASTRQAPPGPLPHEEEGEVVVNGPATSPRETPAMSCDAAAIALALRLASYRPDAAAPRLIRAAASARPPGNPLAREPLFASIVRDASRLRDAVDALRTGRSPADEAALGRLDARAQALAALDMKGHLTLAGRGADGDLKCILKGIAQDMPRKVAALRAAAPAGRRAALDELWYLLRDNMEVVTAPSRLQSSDPVA